MSRRRLIRKIPGAARDLFIEAAGEYTVREWADALGVHVETVREHAKRAGVRCRPGSFRMHSFAERRERSRRVDALCARIAQAAALSPDPEISPAEQRRRTVSARVWAARPSYAGSEGVSRSTMVYARIPWGSGCTTGASD